MLEGPKKSENQKGAAGSESGKNDVKGGDGVEHRCQEERNSTNGGQPGE